MSDERLTPSGQPLVQEAARFAKAAQAGQVYRRPPGEDDWPYRLHLKAVVDVLERFGVKDAEMLAAGWLHDVVEDTRVSLEELRTRFGSRVAELVDGLTDADGASRAEKKAATYPKTAAVPGAVIIKLADRIANVEAAGPGTRHLTRYRQEMQAFEAALRRPGEAERMWAYLRSLLGLPETL